MAFCTDCGANVPDNTRFCTECGKVMGETTAPAAAAPAMEPTPAPAPIPAPASAPTPVPTLVTAPPPAYNPAPTPAPAAAPIPAPSIAAAPTPPVMPGAQPSYQPPTAYAPTPYTPMSAGEVAPPPGSKYATISTLGYIGYSILFALPLLGPLVALIMAFAAKKLNVRNYARAMLIFMIVALVISIILYFVMKWAIDAFIMYMNNAFGGSLGMDMSDLMNMLK